jgi:hypothetical protein
MFPSLPSPPNTKTAKAPPQLSTPPKTKQNKAKQNKTKQNKAKQNKTTPAPRANKIGQLRQHIRTTTI